MSEIRVDSITDEVGTSSPDFPNGILKSSLPSGSVIQVVQAVKTDFFTTGTASFVDVPGWAATITPSSVSNKILLYATCAISADSNDQFGYIRFLRNSTVLQLADQRDSETLSHIDASLGQAYSSPPDVAKPGFFTYLDSPSTTSSITYKAQAFDRSGFGITGIGGTIDFTGGGGTIRTSIPTIMILMEIAG